MAGGLSFIYTGYEPESGDINITLNGKDYRGHLNPADIVEFEKILKRNDKIGALNYLKNRTMGGLKQVNDPSLNEITEEGIMKILKDLYPRGLMPWRGLADETRNLVKQGLVYRKAGMHGQGTGPLHLTDKGKQELGLNEGLLDDERKKFGSQVGKSGVFYGKEGKIIKFGYEKGEPVWVVKFEDGTTKNVDCLSQSIYLTEVMASAEMESKLQEFYQLSQKLAQLTKEVKSIQASIGGLEEDITAELERAEDNVLETKKFLARIQRKGYDRDVPKYKEAFDFLMSKVTPALKKIGEEALEATKSVSRVKASITIAKQGQPITEELKLWDRVKNILRGIARKIGGYNDVWEQALAQVNARMTESSVKKTITELFEGRTKA